MGEWLALGSALCFAGSNPCLNPGYLTRKAGLQDTPDPLLGAMVGTPVGAALFAFACRGAWCWRRCWVVPARPGCWPGQSERSFMENGVPHARKSR